MIRRILTRRPVRFAAGASLVLSAVLMFAMYAYIPAEAATPAPTAPIGAQPSPASAFTAPDPVSAQVKARSMGQKIEVLSELTATSTTWANPNGTFTSQSFGTPIRVADAKSPTGWDDIDYDLQKNPDGTISPKVDNVPVVLSGKATAAQAATSGVVSINNSSASGIGFGWDGALPEPTLDGATATYANVAPNLNLVVKLTATGFEQYYVLTAAPTAAETNLLLPLVTKGLTASQASDGSVTFKNSKDQRVAVIPTAYMWDSRVDPKTGLPLDEVPLTVGSINLGSLGTAKTSAVTKNASAGALTGSTGGDSPASSIPSLTLSAPTAFFTDPNIQYPVTIDPAANEGDSGDVYVRSGADATTKYQSFDRAILRSVTPAPVAFGPTRT